jgi:hypothetical protein
MAKPPTANGTHTEEELVALRGKAKAKVLAEKKKAAETELLKKFEQEARAEDDPEEEMVSIMIDLPGHSDRITVDGKIFFHGSTYTVPRRKFDSLRDIVSLAWDHEDSVQGANTNDYRRPRNINLSPSNPDGLSQMRF